MRFTSNGPDIPDYLLQQRDAGNVVFLCGAGVSMPSGLPSFETLTRNIINKLSPAENSRICKAIKTWDKRNDPTEQFFKAPLDQIFNYLQEEYGRDYIGALVAKHLSFPEDKLLNSNCHDVIARISVNDSGTPQIVTTNFDHLFEKVDKLKNAKKYLPPSTPEIQHGVPPKGITYLHGRLNDTETESHNYILSSSDFGKAYLSQAWATDFVKQLLQNYVVVLLGYSAEDPPIKYLLQGLNSGKKSLNSNIYAFDMGQEQVVQQKWNHLGVNVIAYPETDNHSSLWVSLKKWAEKSDNPQIWQNYVIGLSQQNPRELSPFERGIVSSFVRDPLGAQLFSQADTKPHPEWICVFDPSVRLARGHTQPWGEETRFNPIEHYGLDSDSIADQKPGATNSHVATENVLCWGVGEQRSIEHLTICNSGFIPLPARMNSICSWLANSVESPVIAWWLARQETLHPELLRMMRFSFDGVEHEKAKTLLNQIIEAIEYKMSPWSRFGLYDILEKVKKEGWNRANLNAFSCATKPYFKIYLPYGVNAVCPPAEDWDNLSICLITDLNVELPEYADDIDDIKDEELVKVFRVINENLLQAAEMHKEIGTHWHDPIFIYPPSESGAEDGYKSVNNYAKLFRDLIDRLAILHPEHFRAFVTNWPNNTYLMSMFKLYAFNKSELYSSTEITELVLSLPHTIFWSSFCSQELLYLLRDNWSQLSNNQQDSVCARLLNEGVVINSLRETESERETVKKVERILWLNQSDAKIPRKWLDKVKQIKSSLTDWHDQWIYSAISKGGIVSQTYSVQIENCSDEMRSTPVNRILQKCREISEQKNKGIRLEPFHGVVKETPKRALLAIFQESRKRKVGDYWQILIDEWPLDAPKKQTTLILLKLLKFPQTELFALRYSLQRRFSSDFKHLALADPDFALFVFGSIFNTIRTANNYGEETNKIELAEDKPFNGYQDAKNSFVGKMTTALLNALYELKKKRLKQIPVKYKQQLEALLYFDGEVDKNCLCILAIHTDHLMHIELEWPKEFILPHFDLNTPHWEYAWHSIIQKYGSWLGNLTALVYLKEDFLKLTKNIRQLNWSNQEKKHIVVWCIQSITLTETDEPKLNAQQVKDLLRCFPQEQLVRAIDFLVQVGNDVDNGWQEKVIPFLKNAWPREKHCRSEATTVAFIRMLGRAGDLFPEALNSIAHLLIPISKGNIHFRQFHNSKPEKNLTFKFPKETLKMFELIITDSIQTIPNGLKEVMTYLVESDPQLENDIRYRKIQKLMANVGGQYG